MSPSRFVVLLLILCAAAASAQQKAEIAAPPKDRSHSRHGPAFNQGPRQLARRMEGIGGIHFPVTTKSREAQAYFDQGINLAYSFWWYEAERAFRHAAALDPDCAMAYWGLALAAGDRGKEFIKLAEARKRAATDRERRYIEAMAVRYRETKTATRQADFVKAVEALVTAYPDDNEALVWLANTIRERRSDNARAETLLRAVLAKNPRHPGAHHYRIHLWDEARKGATALDSCAAYPGTAPRIGHVQHMPGHIYAQLGRWEEAADAMDAAARVERRYMYEQGRLSFHTWNYAHNQHYLIWNLGYLGRIQEGLALARELIEVPRDPQANRGEGAHSTAGQGRTALLRMRLRGERWDDILADKRYPWPDDRDGRFWRLYSAGLAHVGKGSLDDARKQADALEVLLAEKGKDGKPPRPSAEMECARHELRGQVAVAGGDFDRGLADLRKAADIYRTRITGSDPNPYPRPAYEALAGGYLRARRWADAEAALREGLRREPNNGFALCQLAEALRGAGKQAEAEAVYDRLRVAFRHADPDLPALRRAQALGLTTPEPFPTPPRTAARAEFGPARWKPFPAPDAALTAPDGTRVRIADYKGRNLVLVFYLGGACSHCMDQLAGLGREKAALAALDTQIVAVSPDAPETQRGFLAAAPGYPLPLFSDQNAQAARRFSAYDEFEDRDLHATILIDKKGRVWWFRSGSAPFTDFAFLKAEIARMNDWLAREEP